MPRKTLDATASEYATVTVTHHALTRERAESMRRRRPRKAECVAVGHAWTEDPGREGGTICLICSVVRWP